MAAGERRPMTLPRSDSPRWKPRTYYSRQALYLAIALAVLLATYQWLASSAWLRGAAPDSGIDAFTVAELLARVDADGAEGLRTALSAAMRARAVDAVWLTEDGRVSAFAERRDDHVRILTGSAAASMPTPSPSGQPYRPGGGERVRMVVMTRRLDPAEDKARGSVYVKPAAERAHAEFGEWIGYVIAFLAALGAGLLLIERIIRPVSSDLARLTEYARRMEEPGQAPPKVPSASEFAELANALARTAAHVTEQRQLARAAHERLSAAIESLEDGFVLFDANDRLVLCNEPYRRIYGRSADLLVPGARFEDIVREGVRRGQYALDGADAGQWIAERLARHHGADGTSLTQSLADGVWVRVAERRTPDGGVVGFRVDITELVEANSRARAASQAKTEFIANMSHVLRTPLTGVIGLLALRRGTRIDAEQEEYVRIANDSAGALLEIISDVLDVAKIESGRLELEFTALQPADEARAVARAFAPAAHAKGLSFEVRDRLGAGTRLGDPARLRQVLRNLVSNAIKFTDRGRVELRVSSEQGGIRFEVEDTGIGIPAAFRGQLYQPFAQADASVNRRFGGTGLGLAITRDLVTRMGGRIDLDSVPGRGTTFSVFLPLATTPPAPAPAPSPAPSPAPTPARAALEGLDIIVAEDNDTSRLVVVRILERGGARVRGASSGAAALALFDAGRPDVLVTDLYMGEMSGFDLAREVRSRDARDGRHTPVLALTASAQAVEREHCLAAGMDGFVSKPFTADRLCAELLKVRGSGAPASPPASAPEPSVHPFARALDYLDGDAALLLAAASVARREMLERDPAMRASLERRDHAALAIEAHRARYAWSLFGPAAESGLLDAIEDHARAGDYAPAERATLSFLERQTKVADAIGAWLSTQAPERAQPPSR